MAWRSNHCPHCSFHGGSGFSAVGSTAASLIQRRENVASEEHTCNKLSTHGFDVRERMCTCVTKETCTHGVSVVPGRLPRALNPGVENPFEDPLQCWGISKNIIITQKTLQMSFYLVLLPPHCAGCPQWQAAAQPWPGGGAGLQQMCTSGSPAADPAGLSFPVALASTGHFWGWPPLGGDWLFSSEDCKLPTQTFCDVQTDELTTLTSLWGMDSSFSCG